MSRSKNRFDVQVVFPDITFGIKNRTDVELTPNDVADALEEFCARIRNNGKMPAPLRRSKERAPQTGEHI
jgi:hypothetical protein